MDSPNSSYRAGGRKQPAKHAPHRKSHHHHHHRDPQSKEDLRERRHHHDRHGRKSPGRSPRQRHPVEIERPESRKMTAKEKINREFKWNDEICESVPPSEYTITHVNQNHDLLRLGELKVAPEMNLNSWDWLKSYGVDSLKLNLKELLTRGNVSKPISDKTGKAIQHITFDANHVNEFEFKLNIALEMYSKRIKWLTQSSRKTFGLINGDRVAVLIDSSNSNLGFGRAIEFQDSLLNLLDEQLCKKKQLYMLTFGSENDELWKDSLKDVHHRTIEEAKLFITHMKPSGGCNLLKAIKRALSIKSVDSLVIILGSVPDQSAEVLGDYIYQSIISSNVNLHYVSYEMNNHIVNSALKKIAEDTSGKYHCFSNSQEQMIFNSTDINMILKEIGKVQDVLARIKEMKQGMLGSAIIQIENEIVQELEKCPQAKLFPRPFGHDQPLKIESSNAPEKMSIEWIEQYGLKAKRLNLYQVLAPNAYNFTADYVPILNKTVSSQVFEKAMIQFTWHDGTVKNLHVDLATLYDFQKRLKDAVRLYEKRIEWLSSSSRKIFGSVSEDSVVILIDLSWANSNYLIHIQHSLRLLMEQQILNKKFFNIIGFGRTIKKWKPTVIKPSYQLLQEAWKWVLELECEGTRDVMGGLKAALENEEENKHNISIDGIYLFTSGMPDQSVDTLCSYLEEKACESKLKCHTILFNVDDYDINGPIPGRWANITKTAEALRQLAHCVRGGRFHWFRETGIIESDDIKEIKIEIDRAILFSRMAAGLVDKIRKKTGFDSDEEAEEKPIEKSKFQTTRSATMTSLRDKSLSEDEFSKGVKSIQDKDTTTKQKRSISRSNSTGKVEQFYMGGSSNSKGTIVVPPENRNNKLKKVVPAVSIPEREESMTTKDWLRRYSMTKLNLDLYKLVSGPICKHDTILIGTQKKDITARYCSDFPSINLNGTIRHLNLKPGELIEYQLQCEKVLKRYVKRLQWLLSGSRKIFGTVVHHKLAILIDTSGSMNEHMVQLKRELTLLVWEQLFKNNVKFNMIRFSSDYEKWKDSVVDSNETNCHEAIAWIESLTAEGNTCTLAALREAFDDPEIEAIYMITDGKPDQSTNSVLEETRKMNTKRNLSINVVSFNCDEKTANDFLFQLSLENNGRFHKSLKPEGDLHLWSHRILTEGFNESSMAHVPSFEGDDLKRLTNEIKKAMQFLKQSITFNRMYDKRDTLNDEIIIGPIHINNSKSQQKASRKGISVDYML